jgi:hypothetical protein
VINSKSDSRQRDNNVDDETDFTNNLSEMTGKTGQILIFLQRELLSGNSGINVVTSGIAY